MRCVVVCYVGRFLYEIFNVCYIRTVFCVVCECDWCGDQEQAAQTEFRIYICCRLLIMIYYRSCEGLRVRTLTKISRPIARTEGPRSIGPS